MATVGGLCAFMILFRTQMFPTKMRMLNKEEISGNDGYFYNLWGALERRQVWTFGSKPDKEWR